MSDLLTEQLRVVVMTVENDRLRALNAKLVTACEMFVAWDEDAHSTEVEAGALRRAMSAALAEAREPQQPPQGLPSDGA